MGRGGNGFTYNSAVKMTRLESELIIQDNQVNYQTERQSELSTKVIFRIAHTRLRISNVGLMKSIYLGFCFSTFFHTKTWINIFTLFINFPSEAERSVMSAYKL